jgi:hypothetical protein
MFARVRVTNGVPERADEGILQFRDGRAIVIRTSPASRAATYFVERTNGKLIEPTLWPARQTSMPPKRNDLIQTEEKCLDGQS